MARKLQYNIVTINPEFCYLEPRISYHADMAEEISASLTRKKRFIHPKFFYDKKGSELFEQISILPEYYLTRSEMEVLEAVEDKLPKNCVQGHALIELGSGSAKKTMRLMEIFTKRNGTVEYYPIDISEILKESSVNLQKIYKNLKITGILDQYENGLEFIKLLDRKKFIVFLGSSLGNFENKGAVKLLKKIGNAMKKGDFFLLGLDMVKEKKVLEDAYSDSQGITSKFNLNLLTRINRELGGNFNLENFEHKAYYNSKQSRIEMYLRSKCEQEVFISKKNLKIRLKNGEMILTEYSHKYTIPKIRQMAKKTGFKIENIWFDNNRYFGLVLLSV